jgi:hypothetical protein
MSYVKRIICFANSWKTGGTCVAGKEITLQGYGGWLRPVSVRPTAEVSYIEARYVDYSSPKLMDVMDVHLASPAPKHHQTENHVIDTTHQWVKIGELPFDSLKELCDWP